MKGISAAMHMKMSLLENSASTGGRIVFMPMSLNGILRKMAKPWKGVPD
jgi:hypothetical protein